MSTRLAVLLVATIGCDGSYVFDPPGDPDDPSDPGGGGDDTGGGGGSDGGSSTPTADFSIQLDASSANLALGETKQLTVTVQGRNGFFGPVALSAADLPPSWEVTFTPIAAATVPIDGTTTVTAVVRIPTDAEALNATVEIAGVAESGTTHAAPLLLEVRPELVLRIPPNALNNPATSFGGSVTVRYVAPGTKVVWVNDDTVTHRIHADGSGGLAHEADQMASGQSYTVTIVQPGTYDYSCHIHPQMTGRLVVTDAL